MSLTKTFPNCQLLSFSCFSLDNFFDPSLVVPLPQSLFLWPVFPQWSHWGLVPSGGLNVPYHFWGSCTLLPCPLGYTCIVISQLPFLCDILRLSLSYRYVKSSRQCHQQLFDCHQFYNIFYIFAFLHLRIPTSTEPGVARFRIPPKTKHPPPQIIYLRITHLPAALS